MTATGYNGDKLYLSGTAAMPPRPMRSDTLDATVPEANGPAATARESYDRAVADYQSCLLDHTSNVSACEKQRAMMNADANLLFGSSGPSNTIVNLER